MLPSNAKRLIVDLVADAQEITAASRAALFPREQ
jgi:hypothetical protein